MKADKDRTAKYATEMEQHEFTVWATGYVLFAIGEGTPLRSAIEMVVNQAASNKVFGGAKA